MVELADDMVGVSLSKHRLVVRMNAANSNLQINRDSIVEHFNPTGSCDENTTGSWYE